MVVLCQKQHPGVLKKGSKKDKKDEKIGLTKGEGFDIMAKLTWGTELLRKRKMMKIIGIKCDAPWKLNNDKQKLPLKDFLKFCKTKRTFKTVISGNRYAGKWQNERIEALKMI